MARARNIKPTFFVDEDLVELSFSTRLLFIGLWTLADREGRLPDKPKSIKMSVFPCDKVDVDKALNELAGAGFLVRYVVDNKGYIEIRNFAKHQRPHPNEAASELPEPPPVSTIVRSTREMSEVGSDLSEPIRSSLNSELCLLNSESGTLKTESESAPPKNRDLVLIEWFDAIAPVMGAKNRFGLTRQAAWKSVCHICISEGYKPPELVSAIQRLLDAPKFETKYFTPEKALDELRVNKNGKTQSSKLPSVAEKLAADQAARNAPRPKPPMRRVPQAGQIDSNVSNGDRPA